MKAQNITIDINRLTVEQLHQLRAMIAYSGDPDWAAKIAQINDREAFVEGWMSEANEKAYYEKWCE